ncbi:MAG: ATP-binding protein [Muribaculaceae bacterium]|nr:ATP-binding protein [Muribaculaceae bacterium]
MYRKAIEELKQWKARKNRKPLILRGARQVGKTWLMKEFAATCYKKHVYINFEDEEILQNIFEHDFDINRIIESIELRFHVSIDDETLLIFDEIQSAHRGVTSLKYFYEKAPEMHIIVADSMLGLSTTESIPVGKVDYLNLYPMTFEEFLMAMGKERIAEAIKKQNWIAIQAVSDLLINDLKSYYFVGGMPEAVLSFVENRDYDEVRRIQNNILISYDSNFAKHAPADVVPRIRMVWNSLPSQLSHENKKFIYGAVKHGSRAKDFELALQWLVDAGLVIKVNRAKTSGVPLNAFEDMTAFKLFAVDVGLLSAMNKVRPESLVMGNELLTTYKGALTEQFVAQHLVTFVDFLFYWSAENSRGEIDFLVQVDDKIIPIEVKAEENLKSKSLRTFVQMNPNLHGLRLSMSNYRQQDWMDNVPLYAIAALKS